MDKKSIQNRIEALRAELHKHNHRYYILDAPIISDYEFDQLLVALQNLEDAHPEFFDSHSPSQRVGGGVTKHFETQKHVHPMYSLANSYSKQDLLDWEERILKTIDTPVTYVCELKYDGASINITYKNGKLESAVTRGDGTQGDNITQNIKTIRTIPLELQGNDYPDFFEIRGEIILPKKGFEKMNLERKKLGEPLYANPRNTASGSLKLQDSQLVAKRPLECFLYSIVGDDLKLTEQVESLQSAKEWGFKVPDVFLKATSINEVIAFIEHWESERENLDYEIDGVVVKVNNLDQQKELGFTSKAPRWAMAYKYKTTQKATRLLNIEYQVGRTGAITPVAHLAPINIDGSMVKRASVHNADQIKKLDLRITDTVFVEKGGEIIPKIVGVDRSKRKAESVPLTYATHCPECQTPLVRTDGDVKHYCPNTDNCLPQVVGRIEHFISRKALNIQYLGSETVALLVKNKLLTDYTDLYTLTTDQLLPLERMAQKSADNIITAISGSKQVSFERVLYGLGIRFVGNTVAKRLASHFRNIDALSKANQETLENVPEIGVKIAKSVTAYFADIQNIERLKKLKSYGIHLSLPELTEEEKMDTQLPQLLTGENYVVSGVFQDITRSELKKLIEKLGGKVTGSISKKTSFIVAGENMGPSKLEKAQKLGITIVSEQEFLKRCNNYKIEI